MRLLVTLFLGLFICAWVYAQEKEDFILKNLEANDITKVLPPLDSLVQMAYETSAELKYQDADQKYWKARVSLAKTEWLDYFYLEAIYSYGIFDNLTASRVSGAPQEPQTLFSTKQSIYRFGPSLKIPISAILNRKNTIKRAKGEAERSQYEKEAERAKIREVVIVRYSKLIQAHRLLFVYGSMVDTYQVQSKRAETEYTNGIIEVAEFTRLHQMLNEAIIAYEAQKSELSLAILLLEEVIGRKLNFLSNET